MVWIVFLIIWLLCGVGAGVLIIKDAFVTYREVLFEDVAVALLLISGGVVTLLLVVCEGRVIYKKK